MGKIVKVKTWVCLCGNKLLLHFEKQINVYVYYIILDLNILRV